MHYDKKSYVNVLGKNPEKRFGKRKCFRCGRIEECMTIYSEEQLWDRIE